MSDALPAHMRSRQLKFQRQFVDGGLTVRFVACRCPDECHVYAVLVACEQFGDRWFPAFETEREDWSIEVAWEDVRDALRDGACRMAAVRACGLLGCRWGELTYPLVLRLMARVTGGPGWLQDELARWEPVELRRLAELVVGDPVPALGLLRWARLEVGGRVPAVLA